MKYRERSFAGANGGGESFRSGLMIIATVESQCFQYLPELLLPISKLRRKGGS
jgi:hypothetical protein